MKKKTIVGIVLLIIIVVIVIIIVRDKHKAEANSFEFGRITRGNIVSTVSSTGTLSAKDTVQVGTQVSGTIVKIFANYNSRVKKGEVLAILDTIPLQAAVHNAEAGLATAKAQLQEAQSNYDRDLPLYNKGYLSENNFVPVQTNLAVQKAAVKSAEALLTTARQNLGYATIRSPISGTVLQRSVEVGQTVAASFATPTLFVIAQDLTKMEIQAQVDESDIGQVVAGQKVTFQVPAFPDSTFYGKVDETYLQPTVIQNVVNYTVIVDVNNKSLALMPGMTATVTFIVAKRDSVLRVPNAALFFQPSMNMIQTFENTLSHEPKAVADSLRPLVNELLKNARPPQGTAAPIYQGGQLPNDVGAVWTVDDHQQPVVVFFKTGITDGLNTEVVGGSSLHEGMEVITGINITQSESGGSQRHGPRPF